MANLGSGDFWFTNDGDLQTDLNGDIKDTMSTLGRAIVQEIRTRIRADRGDWQLNKSIGANLEGFLGQPNSESNVRDVCSAIIQALTFDRFLLPGEVEVLPLPIGPDILYIRIIVHTSQGDITEQFGYNSTTARFIGY